LPQFFKQFGTEAQCHSATWRMKHKLLQVMIGSVKNAMHGSYYAISRERAEIDSAHRSGGLLYCLYLYGFSMSYDIP
jgi:hypothetical protein